MMKISTRSEGLLVDVGKRLQATRLALDLKQEELAGILGVTRGALANWERGSRMADVGAMMRFATRFNLTLDWIYRGEPAGLPFYRAKEILGETLPPSTVTADSFSKAG